MLGRTLDKRPSALMVEGLSEDQVLSFKSAFTHLDQNEDGLITPKELGRTMAAMAAPAGNGELTAEQIVAKFDKDGEGHLKHGLLCCGGVPT